MTDLEHLRLTAARQAYRLNKAGSVPQNHETWIHWWEAKFGEGETFRAYTYRNRKRKTTETVA